jgi:hypothetical protein
VPNEELESPSYRISILARKGGMEQAPAKCEKNVVQSLGCRETPEMKEVGLRSAAPPQTKKANRALRPRIVK